MRKRYAVLNEQRAKVLEEAGKLLDRAEQENRALTNEEKSTFDGLHAQAEGFRSEIELMDRQAQAEAALDLPATGRIQLGGPRILDDPKWGFRDMADFALAVARANRPGAREIDPRLTAIYQAQPTNFHRETGSDEGYMVPPEIRERIWEVVTEEPDLVTMVDSEPTSSNAVQILKDETTPWGSAGVQAKWRAEGTKMDPSRLETKAVQVRLNELYAFVLATDELLEDAPRLSDRLTRKAGGAIRWAASDAIAFGDGVGKPLGYMNSPALVTVSKESGQAAATVVKENIAKMFARMLPSSVRRSVWLANTDVFPQLSLLNTGTGGQLIWTPPTTGLAGAPGGFLYGRPIIFTEHAQTLGTVGDLQFVDPQGYYLTTKRGGIDFASSIHLYFDYGIQAFRWTFRLAGQPYLSAPVSPARGAATKSHFVVLETRS
jgi:HK97 family phage major capsid protein